MNDADTPRLTLLQAQGLTPRLKMLIKRRANLFNRPLHYKGIIEALEIDGSHSFFVCVVVHRLRNGRERQYHAAYLRPHYNDWRHL
jgi:hypothetical protein